MGELRSPSADIASLFQLRPADIASLFQLRPADIASLFRPTCGFGIGLSIAKLAGSHNGDYVVGRVGKVERMAI